MPGDRFVIRGVGAEGSIDRARADQVAACVEGEERACSGIARRQDGKLGRELVIAGAQVILVLRQDGL